MPPAEDALHRALQHLPSRGSEGMGSGPDLITVKTRGRDSLLATSSIRTKSRSAVHRVRGNTKDGNAYLGMIVRDVPPASR